MPVGKPEESGHNRQAKRHGQQLFSGHRGGRVSDDPDQRERPHAAERVSGLGRLVLLAFQPEQKREEQHQSDLDAFGRERAIEVAKHDGSVAARGGSGSVVSWHDDLEEVLAPPVVGSGPGAMAAAIAPAQQSKGGRK